MTRKKVKLAYIIKRNAVFRKLKNDLINELTKQIEACAVISGPEVELEAQRLISKYNKMPKEEQIEGMLYEIAAFLEQRDLELYEQLKKKREDNHKVIMLLLQQYLENGQNFTSMSVDDINTLKSWAREFETPREFEFNFDQMPALKLAHYYGLVKRRQDDGPEAVSTEGDQQNTDHSQVVVTSDGEEENIGHAQDS